VKFTPEEMAIDAADVDASKDPSMKELKRFLSFKNGFAKLDPDVRKAFPNNRVINEVLRHAAEIMKIKPAGKQRKSA